MNPGVTPTDLHELASMQKMYNKKINRNRVASQEAIEIILTRDYGGLNQIVAVEVMSTDSGNIWQYNQQVC